MPKLIQLATPYGLNAGFTHKIVLNYVDVKALTSGTAYSVLPERSAAGVLSVVAAASAGTLAAGTVVKQAAVRVTTAFASAANTITLVMIMGDGGDTARYAASTTLKTAAYFGMTLKMPLLYTTADTVDIIITAGVEAITVLTAGEVEIYLELRTLDGLALPYVLPNS